MPAGSGGSPAAHSLPCAPAEPAGPAGRFGTDQPLCRTAGPAAIGSPTRDGDGHLRKRLRRVRGRDHRPDQSAWGRDLVDHRRSAGHIRFAPALIDLPIGSGPAGRSRQQRTRLQLAFA
jgi:hypothetical protein